MTRLSLRCLGGVAAIVMALSALSAAAQERSTALQATAVRRTTLLVDNLEKSMDFYQRLGLTKWYDAASDSNSPDGVIGAADLPLTEDPKVGRIVIMKGNDERIGMIGLLSYDKPKLASARGNLMGIGTGDAIIMMEVADIQATYSRLQHFERAPYPQITRTHRNQQRAFNPRTVHLFQIVRHSHTRSHGGWHAHLDLEILIHASAVFPHGFRCEDVTNDIDKTCHNCLELKMDCS